jgi:hypothetical protein
VCTVSRYFWFRWKKQSLQVGTGSLVGSNMIMEHSKADHPSYIASVSISTGWSSAGRWEIGYAEGETALMILFAFGYRVRVIPPECNFCQLIVSVSHAKKICACKWLK